MVNGCKQLGAVDGSSVGYGWLTLVPAYGAVGVLCCYIKGRRRVATFGAFAFVSVKISAVEVN